MTKREQAWFILQKVRTGDVSETDALEQLESLGMVFKAELQTPPRFAFSEESPNWKNLAIMRFNYQKAIEDMLNQGWVKEEKHD